jgi:hypothetical protein
MARSMRIMFATAAPCGRVSQDKKKKTNKQTTAPPAFSHGKAIARAHIPLQKQITFTRVYLSFSNGGSEPDLSGLDDGKRHALLLHHVLRL